jgi:hypothetical protein
MHVTDPFAFRPARIFFFQVQVFGYLGPDSHMLKLMCCKNKTDKDDSGFNSSKKISGLLIEEGLHPGYRD